MTCSCSAETWKARIKAARARREKHEPIWAYHASLHAKAKVAALHQNDDQLAVLPNGDQVRLSLVHRNVEQTMALLEVPEIGVRATATDYTHELTGEDTHREAVVEQATYKSLTGSGLLSEAEVADAVKRDGIVIGHGVSYSWWRQVMEEGDPGAMLTMIETAPGVYEPAAPDPAAPAPSVLAWEGVQDEHILPTEFLFDAAARSLHCSPWHGYERVMKLDALKADPRFVIPEDIEPTAYKVKDLYGEEPDEVASPERDSVRFIVIWDKLARELIHFLETPRAPGKRRKREEDIGLVELRRDRWPYKPARPDGSPFNFFVPIPANDHPFGVSQVTHIRNSAEEADKLRTRQANLTRQIKRVGWYRKGRGLDHDQLMQALKSPDFALVGIDMQDGEKPEQVFGELPTPSVHPELYRQAQIAAQDVTETSGVSNVPGSGADTATEAEFIYQTGNARPQRKKNRYLAWLTSVAGAHLDLLRAFAAEGQTLVVPDESGMPITLSYGRAALQGVFELRVTAGGGAMAMSPVKQKMMLDGANLFLNRFSPAFDRIFVRELLTGFDVRSVNALTKAMMSPGMPGAGGPGGPPLPNTPPSELTTGQALRRAINAPREG